MRHAPELVIRGRGHPCLVVTPCNAIRSLFDSAPEEATASRPHTPKLAFVARPAAYTASDGRRVEAASIDLLARICDPMTGIKEVWDFLTQDDEDEIARIAADIKLVVDNLEAETAVLASEMAPVVAQAATL